MLNVFILKSIYYQAVDVCITLVPTASQCGGHIIKTIWISVLHTHPYSKAAPVVSSMSFHLLIDAHYTEAKQMSS